MLKLFLSLRDKLAHNEVLSSHYFSREGDLMGNGEAGRLFDTEFSAETEAKDKTSHESGPWLEVGHEEVGGPVPDSLSSAASVGPCGSISTRPGCATNHSVISTIDRRPVDGDQLLTVKILKQGIAPSQEEGDQLETLFDENAGAETAHGAKGELIDVNNALRFFRNGLGLSLGRGCDGV